MRKLKQQNDKLKSELQQLTSALEDALKKQKQAEQQTLRPNFSEADGNL